MDIEMLMSGYPNAMHFHGDIPDQQYIFRPNEINIGLQGENYFLGTDPSSTSTGIFVLNLDTMMPEVNLNLYRRTLPNGKTQDGDSLIDNVITFLANLIYCNPGKIKWASTERAYDSTKAKSKKKQKGNFYNAALLASGYSRVNSLLRNNNIPNFCTSAPEWKAWFLPFHELAHMIHIPDSNKPYIKDVAIKFYPPLKMLSKQDAFDAFGIGHFWVNNHWNYIQQGIINVTPSMDRNYHYKMVYKIKKLVDNPDTSILDAYGLPLNYNEEMFLDSLETRKALISEKLNPNCKIWKFNYCDKLSLEENFQALQYLMSENIYYTIKPVTNLLLSELVAYKDTIGNLNVGDKLLIGGYPARL